MSLRVRKPLAETGNEPIVAQKRKPIIQNSETVPPENHLPASVTRPGLQNANKATKAIRSSARQAKKRIAPDNPETPKKLKTK